MKRFQATSLLLVLIVCSAQAQAVRPILVDSVQHYIVTRAYLEYSLHRMELAPIQRSAIESLRIEIGAANNQIVQRDAVILNLRMDAGVLGDINELLELQFRESEANVVLLEGAWRRAKLWRNVSHVVVVALGIKVGIDLLN